MKSINYLIVELDEAYQNEIEVSTGDKVIINSTIENVSSINRVATVIDSPSFTILKKGDNVVVHHNIFRLRNDTSGNVVESNFYIGDNKYFIPLTEVFMYKRGDSDWLPISPFCFVQPIKKKEKEGFDLNPVEDTYKGNLIHRAVMKYPNQELLDQGVNKGDLIVFSKNSEYEFDIDGELYYKMRTKDILAVE